MIRSFLSLSKLSIYVMPCAPSPDDIHSILYINRLSKCRLFSTKLSTNLGWLYSYVWLPISTPVLHASLHVVCLTSLLAEIFPAITTWTGLRNEILSWSPHLNHQCEALCNWPRQFIQCPVHQWAFQLATY